MIAEPKYRFMKKLLEKTLLIFITAASLSACKDDKENTNPGTEAAQPVVKVELNTKYLGADFVPGTTYTTANNYPVRIDIFKTYICMVQLKDVNGNVRTIKDFSLIDFLTEDPVFSASIPAAVYDSLFVSVGIPPEYNTNVDPAIYPSSSPMSVIGAGNMFWNWNSGYLFAMIDGKTDIDNSGDMTDPFAFHIGDDLLYNRLAFDITDIDMKAGETHSIPLNFHVDEIFVNSEDTLDLSVDYLTHTEGNMPLARRVISKLAGSIRLQ
jgi:hypothetical protein